MNGVAVGQKIQCKSEYTRLKNVLVVKPSYMRITEIINETQKHYVNSNINIPLALAQHEAFVKVLEGNGVTVSELQADASLPEQVFTRDIGFTIHDELFVATMNEQVRQSEVNHLITYLDENGVTYQQGLPDSIEGGDVVVDGSTVWVGKSGRTSQEAIQDLQMRLPSYKVEGLSLRKDILHLDCVFNIISEKVALVYPSAFTKDDLRKLEACFQLIYVSEEEQFDMGPNVLSIGDSKIVSLSQNKRLNRILTAQGFQVFPVDFSEIIKSGGSFRCCTLPLERS
ncbi:dimethylarginine dimethylaminohydrolase family protein [Guptibacillus hwajinpoensis]|uniref:dimethylarginine dimethylaminohydrolase family protein n=1 Tax=Guptibacillus hwajinpoensis TaxID=208199 RepID=UPI001CFE2D67|nr:arginine deiminase family protein [Pseudalkalibacillus hwajinpoensis]